MDGGGDWDREVWWLTGDAWSDTATVTLEPGCIMAVMGKEEVINGAHHTRINWMEP
ncbi:anti-FecI sigma factor FecR [Sesbania bispinosa]|nr:anti-FecI sigma factor FecR [Sesbania bispinosa]